MKRVLVLLAACAKPQPPRLEHHAPPPQDETFLLDAPLFSADDTNLVLWKLTRHDSTATLTLGPGHSGIGTFVETDGSIHVEVPLPDRSLTMDCRRGATRVHVAGAQPQERGDHPVCKTPRVWAPADMLDVAVLTCTVHDEQLLTQVTMAASPGLQAIVDDCCDDEDRCERRWEIRLRRTREELAACEDCPCFDELVHQLDGCEARDVAQLIVDARASRIETPITEHTRICHDYASKLAAAGRSCLP